MDGAPRTCSGVGTCSSRAACPAPWPQLTTLQNYGTRVCARTSACSRVVLSTEYQRAFGWRYRPPSPLGFPAGLEWLGSIYFYCIPTCVHASLLPRVDAGEGSETSAVDLLPAPQHRNAGWRGGVRRQPLASHIPPCCTGACQGPPCKTSPTWLIAMWGVGRVDYRPKAHPCDPFRIPRDRAARDVGHELGHRPRAHALRAHLLGSLFIPPRLTRLY